MTLKIETPARRARGMARYLENPFKSREEIEYERIENAVVFSFLLTGCGLTLQQRTAVLKFSEATKSFAGMTNASEAIFSSSFLELLAKVCSNSA